MFFLFFVSFRVTIYKSWQFWRGDNWHANPEGDLSLSHDRAYMNTHTRERTFLNIHKNIMLMVAISTGAWHVQR